MTGRPKRKWPLIRYAGPAAETSIGSMPIGNELSHRFYPMGVVCQPAPLSLAWLTPGFPFP